MTFVDEIRISEEKRDQFTHCALLPATMVQYDIVQVAAISDESSDWEFNISPRVELIDWLEANQIEFLSDGYKLYFCSLADAVQFAMRWNA